MTKAARPSVWLPPLSLVAIIFLIGLIWIFFRQSAPIVILGEALGLIIILRFFCVWPPMVALVSRMPVPHKIMFALAIGGIIAGHYTIQSTRYFPYVAWEIFPAVNEKETVTCHQFLATTASGKKVRLLVEQLFPSIVQVYPLDDATRFPPETIDHLALVLTRSYNKQHATDPVRQLDLVVMAVKLHPPAGESRAEPSCQLLKRYDFSSGR